MGPEVVYVQFTFTGLLTGWSSDIYENIVSSVVIASRLLNILDYLFIVTIFFHYLTPRVYSYISSIDSSYVLVSNMQ